VDADKGTNQGHLGLVGVLVLVDQKVLDALAHAVADLAILGQEFDGEGDHVVEIDTRDALEKSLIPAVDRCHAAGEEIVGVAGEVLRPLEFVLGAADRPEHRTGREGLLVESLGG
jgi:hypothetical protein